LEVGQKPQAIQADEQPFHTGMYQKAIGSILSAAFGTRPDITYAISALGRDAAQPSMLHWDAIKHLLCYLRGTCEYKLTIYDPRPQYHSNSIVWYADADLGGEAESSKLTSGLMIFVLGILLLWRWKKQTLVAQSTMQAEINGTSYGKVQLNWL